MTEYVQLRLEGLHTSCKLLTADALVEYLQSLNGVHRTVGR